MTEKASENKLEDYRLMCKLGEGTFSEVLKVKHKKTGKSYAMKRFRKHFDSSDEIENLREIQALRRLNPHPHIIDLEDVIFDSKHGILCLAFDIMDCNLYELISRKHMVINEAKSKLYMYQICKALEFMHGKGIFHRDIKPENILIKDNLVKIADFGSCRSIHSKQPYTEYIATRWYRSPECLLCDGIYNYKMDVWGAGCVLFEIISKVPLFPGTNELDQLYRIHNVLGTPTPKVLKRMLGNKTLSVKYNFPFKEGTGVRPLLPNASQDCVDLLNSMLSYDPEERITARETMKHAFFRDIDLSDIQPQLEALLNVAAAASITISPNTTIISSSSKPPLAPSQSGKFKKHLSLSESQPTSQPQPQSNINSDHPYLKASSKRSTSLLSVADPIIDKKPVVITSPANDDARNAHKRREKDRQDKHDRDKHADRERDRDREKEKDRERNRDQDERGLAHVRSFKSSSEQLKTLEVYKNQNYDEYKRRRKAAKELKEAAANESEESLNKISGPAILGIVAVGVAKRRGGNNNVMGAQGSYHKLPALQAQHLQKLGSKADKTSLPPLDDKNRKLKEKYPKPQYQTDTHLIWNHILRNK